jgi:Tol biopolymer transport system component
MRRLIALAAVAGMTLLGLVVPTGPAQAVVPGTNGRILFARCIAPFKCFGSSKFDEWEIVAADPNDTNETVLAGPFTRDVFDDLLRANWSPNGTRAIFMADLSGRQAIWDVSADGTSLHQVFRAPAGTFLDDGPAFTPDGKHIIFTRCCGRETLGYSLWMINADGTGLKDVTKEPFVGDGPADLTPQVSPNGKRIVFQRCIPDGCVVATVNIDGSHLRDLTDNTAFESLHPNWSPDSKRIVFSINYFGGGSDIMLVNPDGSGLTQLTFNGEGARNGSFNPCFSPDGTKILFSHFQSTGAVDLFTMNPNGSGTTQVTRTPDLEFAPEWARS